MRPLARHAAAAALAVALLIPAAGCQSLDGHGVRACGRSAKLVPACGVIWGAATEPNTLAYLTTVEAKLGRRFDMTYRFHDLDDQIPTADERAVVASGRILHISIDARKHSAPGQTITWASVASGTYDSALKAQAQGVASLKAPVFVTFDHEPDQPQGGSKGSPADFVAAWRHVHMVFAAAGATNAVWAWVVTGDQSSFGTVGQLWPGNDVVDWISWEAYNPAGCRAGHPSPAGNETFAASALPFYQWVKAHATRYRIDPDKPMMISEAGSVVFGSEPNLTASWYRQIPKVLAAHPQIHAIGLWDRPGNASCDYTFDRSPLVSDAVSDTGFTAPIWRD